MSGEPGKRTAERCPRVRTCLWFDNQALPAAEFYCGILPGSRIEKVVRYPEGGEHPPGVEPGGVIVVEFTLAGTPYQALNGGPHFRLDEAVSIAVRTCDQAETDRLWEVLTSGGGEEGRCGWLMDRFGLSWQIVPRQLGALLGRPGVWPVLMKMRKIDIAALEAAAE